MAILVAIVVCHVVSIDFTLVDTDRIPRVATFAKATAIPFLIPDLASFLEPDCTPIAETGCVAGLVADVLAVSEALIEPVTVPGVVPATVAN